MESGDGGGHKLSFIYPKKQQTLAVNFKSEDVAMHSFDLAGILSSFTKLFSGKFAQFSSLSNPFGGGMTTTTDKNEFDFSDEVTDDDTSLSSSTSSTDDDFSGEHDSSSSGYDSDDKDIGYGYSKPATSGDGDSNGYDYAKPTTSSYSIETVPIKYLPPVTSEYLPPVTSERHHIEYPPPDTDLPIKIYLPASN